MSSEYVMRFATDTVEGLADVGERIVRCRDCKHGGDLSSSGLVTCYRDLEINDAVNRPYHYMGTYGLECSEAIRNALTAEEWRGYCKGNVMKYTWRERGKNGDQDIAKAARYIEMMGETEDGE